MNDTANIIGMTDLLDEVTRDLEDFRKKHASDYGVKNITMWWELERERLLLRHKETRVARRLLSKRRAWTFAVGCLATFLAGVLAALAVSSHGKFSAVSLMTAEQCGSYASGVSHPSCESLAITHSEKVRKIENT